MQSVTVSRAGHRWYASVLCKVTADLPERPTRRQRERGRVGVERNEHTDIRTNYRSGHRDKTLTTQAGDLELVIPKLRAGSFFPCLLERRRPIDQALYAVIMEANVEGVSTRSVDDLVKALGAGHRDIQERGLPDLRRPGRASGCFPYEAAGPHPLPLHLPRCHLLHKARSTTRSPPGPPHSGPLSERSEPAPRTEGSGSRSRLTVVDGARRQQQQQQRVPDPGDLRLRVALTPAAYLWRQLCGGQQAVVVRAAERALGALSGIVGPMAAPRVLAARLTDRLEEVGGEALVRDPMGWLLGRGLVQRAACPDLRCDDGIRLDTGTDRPTCGNIVHTRRALRAQVAARVEAEMPYSHPAARRD